MRRFSLGLWLVCLVFSCFMTSCAGYRLGGNKPSELTAVKRIYVPTFENQTAIPRLAPIITNSVVEELAADGTFLVSSKHDADATLQGQIRQLNYDLLRTTRQDTLRPQEIQLEVLVNYQVIDDQTGKELLDGSVRQRSNVFIADNLQTSRQSAIPDVAKRLSVSLVSRLTNGF